MQCSVGFLVMGTAVKRVSQVSVEDVQPPTSKEKLSMANTAQDSLDMQRLGKTQQLKVSIDDTGSTTSFVTYTQQ